MQILYFILLFSFLISSSHAQDISFIARQDLNFGDEIFPGLEERVDFTDAEAAGFEIIGEPETEIRITLQLPASLNVNSSSIPVSFSTLSAGYHPLETGQATAIAFNPEEGVTTSLGADGKLFIWLGGTIHPSQIQQKGLYTGDIVLEAEYN